MVCMQDLILILQDLGVGNKIKTQEFGLNCVIPMLSLS